MDRGLEDTRAYPNDSKHMKNIYTIVHQDNKSWNYNKIFYLPFRIANIERLTK